VIASRRTVVTSGISALGIGALAPALSPALSPALAHGNPQSSRSLSPLEKFMRIRCSAPGMRTFWWYSGQLLGRIGDTAMRPLFSIVGASQTQAQWQDDGTIAYTMVEAGYYGDLSNGAPNGVIADAPVVNALTGQMVQPEAYLSPQNLVFTPSLEVRPSAPVAPQAGEFAGTITPPDEKDDRVWMAERLFGMLYETPTRKRRVFNSLANFEASRADVHGSGTFVPATMQYTTINSFRPWMNMGDAAGNITSRLNAVKLASWLDVPDGLRLRIDADHPGVFSDA